ncbi:hypothetical protein WJX75_000376 [Coccomyxa subellipsoidea]|uniref:GYF domain-containing protein n=1 Tax=Coccomyxa subellipsoidea TaxID=248742 RepID=A0ABR2YIP1_9CHLO
MASGDMLEHQHCSNEEMGVSNAKGTEQKANGSLPEHVPTAETGLNGCKATSYAAAPPQENGVAGHEPETASIESNKELKSREGEKGGGDKGERSKSRSGKDSRKDSKGDRSRTKASKDKDKDKDKKRSRRSTRSRSRSRRRGSKHRSPSKLSPPRKRRARGSRSSTPSSSPSPRPRFSRGISPGARPPRARPFGGMQRSPPFSRGTPPPAGPWGYGGGPPYEPHGYGPPRGGYSPPRRWPGPGRSPPPYGYERPYGYGGPPPNGSRSPPPGQIYGRNPTTGSPLYGPPPPSHGGPWERALPVEPRPAAQGKVWGARSGWDSVAPDIPARDLPPVARQSPLVPTSSAGPEMSASKELGASRQGVEEAAVPATSRSSRGPQVGDSGWQNGPETTSKPRPSEWSSMSDGTALLKPVAETAALPAGSQQYLPAVSAAEAELRAMVHSVDHSDACWYYIDPQGKTQGPCTIRQFREWLRHMRGDRNLHEELKRFSEVSVWRVGMPFRVKLTVLMAIVVQTSPSPPPSPSPHDGKTFGQHISAR